MYSQGSLKEGGRTIRGTGNVTIEAKLEFMPSLEGGHETRHDSSLQKLEKARGKFSPKAFKRNTGLVTPCLALFSEVSPPKL